MDIFLNPQLSPEKNIFPHNNTSLPNYLTRNNEDITSNYSTDNNLPYIEVNKTSNKNSIVENEEVVYSIEICNRGATPIKNLILMDKLCPSMKFIKGSVLINNNPLLDFTPITGIPLGNLNPNECILVQYSSSLVKRPDDGKIKTIATATYEFICCNDNYGKHGICTSNEHILRGETCYVLLQGHIDKKIANLNDIVTYTLTINNKGTLDIANLKFYSSLPDNMSLISNSFKLNSTMINVENMSYGVSLGNLKSNNTIALEFKAIVTCACPNGTMQTDCHVKFTYKNNELSPEQIGYSSIETFNITAISPNFKEIFLDNMLYIPNNRPNLEEVVDITAQVEIYNYRIVKTLKGISNENKTLTGYKAIITGLLKIFLEYTSKTNTNKVYSTSYESRFSTFLILPEEYIEGTPLEVNSFVEGIYHNIINNRNVFSTASLHVDAKVF